jgi:iron complex outermembrane receptor protein
VVPTQNGDFDFNASYYYNDGFYWDPDNRLREPSYSLVNASIGWTAPNQNWGVRFWGRNLGKAEYCVFSTATTLIDSCSPGSPRTFGVTVSAHY